MFDSVLQGIELNKHFVSLVHASPDFSLVTEPSFALSVIRLTPPSIVSMESDKDKLEATLNDLNKDYYSRLSSRNDVALTQTKMNGTFCIRFAIGAARTKKEHVDRAWEILQQEAQATLSAWGKPMAN